MKHAQATSWRCFDCHCETKIEEHHLVYGVDGVTIPLCPRCHGARHGRFNQYGTGELTPYIVATGKGNVTVGRTDKAGALFMSAKQIDALLFDGQLSTSPLNAQVWVELDTLVNAILKASKAAGLRFNACAYVQGHNERGYNFGYAVVPVLTQLVKSTFNSPAYKQHEAIIAVALTQLQWVSKTLNDAARTEAVPQAAALSRATQTSIASALHLMASGHDTAPGLYGALQWLNIFARDLNPQRVHTALGTKAREMFGKATDTKWVIGSAAGRIEVSARTADQWAAAFKALDVAKLLAK